ncbi:energy transducer TonB [Marinicella rhabdoformis]|uniref:energy transducer TonB n=1 Tax=Marinicella rhabdoformis TaxID=2580566 RepID=UPI0015D0B543|nr:energy transducer TonB [Marinicella rhabdoformis]
MQNIIKYSCLGVSAAYITAVLFLGMLNLLKEQHARFNNETLDFTISYFKTEDDLALKKRNHKKPKKKPKSSKPPALPRMYMMTNQVKLNTSPEKFNYGYNLKAFEYNPLSGPGIDLGKLNTDEMGGVKSALPPIYPPAALFRDKEGWVEVLISINQVGLVDDIKVLKSEPSDIFNEAAINAVKKWAFYPKTKNGIPLPYQITQTIAFNIDRPEE